MSLSFNLSVYVSINQSSNQWLYLSMYQSLSFNLSINVSIFKPNKKYYVFRSACNSHDPLCAGANIEDLASLHSSQVIIPPLGWERVPSWNPAGLRSSQVIKVYLPRGWQRAPSWNPASLHSSQVITAYHPRGWQRAPSWNPASLHSSQVIIPPAWLTEGAILKSFRPPFVHVAGNGRHLENLPASFPPPPTWLIMAAIFTSCQPRFLSGTLGWLWPPSLNLATASFPPTPTWLIMAAIWKSCHPCFHPSTPGWLWPPSLNLASLHLSHPKGWTQVAGNVRHLEILPASICLIPRDEHRLLAMSAILKSCQPPFVSSQGMNTVCWQCPPSLNLASLHLPHPKGWTQVAGNVP
jgi:hypothetical protein